MDIGVVIDHYKIVEHIGRGGMADVWSARDNKLNRMVAIKTIAHGLSQDANPVTMFKQEAQTIAQMEHPHILPIYDFGQYSGQLYIVMRYVTGGSLDELLRRDPLPVVDALRLGLSIAQALDYAHVNNVVHLDLKPPNVLLDSHQSPYLADFGLATVLDPEGKALNPGSGTLLYMAPEQLTSELIDYRADLYSFAIVMFHMLIGQLPFGGAAPMALKQMQFQEELPDLNQLNPAIPESFTAILRRATALEPEARHDSLTEIIEALQSAYLESKGTAAVGLSLASVETDSYDGFIFDVADYDGDDVEILEAVDIYSRARHNWAGGNGRFLLGVTNFMVMNGYYVDAELHGLTLDESGKQMLLRGGIEYDIALDHWWAQLDDDNRRWVCLHALRSGNAPARVRALRRLEDLPDAEPAVIPKLVAQMMQIETNETARIAALQVLGTRAKSDDGNWREVVYTPEIDLLIAETALDVGMPNVSEFAARVIGDIRSISAVRQLANEQRERRKGALRALAVVRDVAPSLPDVVSPSARAYAFANNTLRRMFEDPLSLIFRFTMALIGGWIAMGASIWVLFRTQETFTPQRWGNSLAVGLLFAAAFAVLVIVTDEFSRRLRGFWPWWVRVLLLGAFGMWWATSIWAQFHWSYYQLEIEWDVMYFGGFGLIAALLLAGLFRWRSVVFVPLMVLVVYIPIFTTYMVGTVGEEIGPFTYGEEDDSFQFYTSLFYFEVEYIETADGGFLVEPSQQVYSVGLLFVSILALGAFFPDVVRDLRGAGRYLHERYIVTEVIEDQTPTVIGAKKKVPAPAARLAHTRDPQAVRTEVDVAADEQDEAERTTSLELKDAAPVTRTFEEFDRTELDPGQGMNNDDIPRKDAPDKTELDINQRTSDADTDSQSKIVSKRVDLGTGIRIDLSDESNQTELDASLGLQSTEDDEPEDDEPESE